jgi:hypothetical protein
VSDCAACEAIVGKPETTEPHDRLKPHSGRKLAYGWHEMFACDACGATLQRVSAFPGASKKLAERWSRVTDKPPRR